MPNRILKESICTSETIDSLSIFEEVVFYRLIVNCDDFGRFDARPKILCARLFPLKNISDESMIAAISALEKAGLLTLYRVSGKPYLQVNSWLNHQQKRSDKSKYPDPPAGDANSSDNSCNQVISDDIRFPRERERERIYDNRESESELMPADEAQKIQSEQDRVLTAAEDAGFPKGNTMRASLIALYAEHGLEKMLNAINECVTHSAVSLAYLKAVLNGTGKKAKGFPQRDYSKVNDQMLGDLAKEMELFLKEGT